MTVSAPPALLLITRRDIAAAMAPSDYLAAADRAFRAAAPGEGCSPHPMHLALRHGCFHANGASLARDGGSPRPISAAPTR